MNEDDKCPNNTYKYDENDFYVWNILWFVIIFVVTITFSIIVFGIDFLKKHNSYESDRFGSVMIQISICFVVSFFIYGLMSAIVSIDEWNITSKQTVIFRRVIMSICLFLFVFTSVILSQFVLSYTVQYEDKEYYEQKETICYITETGDCYHREDCGYLHSKIKTTVSSAKAKGYSPCTYCWTDYTTQTRMVTKERIEHHYILSYIISLVFWIGISALIIVAHNKRIKKKQATPE